MSTSSKLAKAAPARASLKSRMPSPVVVWATAGVLFVGLEVYVAVRYLAAGRLDLRTQGLDSLGGGRQAALWGTQLLVVAMVVSLAVWIVMRCRRERRLTIDALLFIGFVSQAGLNPYFSPMAMLKPGAVHIPSWGSYLPGWQQMFGRPDPAVKVEPLLVTGVGYATGLVFALAAAGVMHLLVLRRRPDLGGIRFVLMGLGVCAAIDVPSEAVWIRLGVYAYREGIPAVTLFSGEWYQVPVYLPVISGVLWYGIAYLIRHFYLTNGPESTIFRGTRRLPPRMRTAAQALAVIGLLDLCIVLDCVAFRLFTLLPGQMAQNLPFPFV